MVVARWKEVINGVEVEVLEFSETVENVEKASKLSGEPPSRIVKTLLLKAGENFVIALVRGDRKVDYVKASKVLGVAVRLAKRDDVVEVLGIEPGAVTPLLDKVKLFKVVMDPTILVNEYVLCGGGSLNRLFKVKVKDLVDYLKPYIIDVFR